MELVRSDSSSGGPAIPIETVFAILEAENGAVRKLWTTHIVGAGQERGLDFDKHWREPNLEADPLPALFLRETAECLRRRPVPLYLFLGSDFPVNDANKFTGLQIEYFGEIKRTGEPQFFLDEEIDHHTGMFSDIAVAETCITCHNSESETTKTDWKLGDIMGTTTWSYPKGDVSVEEALSMEIDSQCPLLTTPRDASSSGFESLKGDSSLRRRPSGSGGWLASFLSSSISRKTPSIFAGSGFPAPN